MNDIQPRMSDIELTLFLAAIAGKTCAVEYGVGGSTLRMAHAGIARIVSIDSDPSWVAKVTEHAFLRPLVDSGALTVLLADIGPITDWGFPSDRSRIADWPDYWETPWSHVDPEIVDLVLVDGRFRVACALSSLLHGNSDMTIVIHDFWDRSYYHHLLKYLNCAGRAGNLGVFFSRADIDMLEVATDLVRYAFVTD